MEMSVDVTNASMLKSVILLIAPMFLATTQAEAASATSARWLVGVNLAGAALNPGPGTRLNFQYVYPTSKEIDYFVGKGLKTFRISVLFERLFTVQRRDMYVLSDEWRILMQLVDHAAAQGAVVVIDVHQYGRTTSGLIGRDGKATEEFIRGWQAMAKRLRDKNNVVFGLMNEPNEQSASEWLTAVNACISAIRETGAKQLILVPGSHWSGAASWNKTDNASVMVGVLDPANNFAFEPHVYLDADSSGTRSDVVAGAGATRLKAFTAWAREHQFRAFLGEFGFAATPKAMDEGRALLSYLSANRDVWIGWTYWAAGPWWGDYMFTVEPSKAGDRPQMELLTHAE